jgi:hypothetical protein
MGLAVSLIDTEYTLMMADDEFFLPSGIGACIQELEHDPKLVACMGRTILFTPREGKVYGATCYPGMAEHSFLQESPSIRLAQHMTSYSPSTIYSVVRSHYWQRAMSILPCREFPVFALGELQFEMAIAYMGRTKVIPVAMWLRSDENENIKNPDEPYQFWTWWRDPAQSSAKNEFLKIMVESLRDVSTDSRCTEDEIAAACDLYVVNAKRPGGSTMLSQIRSRIVRQLPPKVREVLRYGKSLFNKRPPLLELNAAAAELAHSGVRVNLDELAEIERIIKEFHARPTNSKF